MKHLMRYALIATLLLAGLAMPVLADDVPADEPEETVAPTTSTYDDGTAIYYTRIALDGSIQQWVYDYSADGTAQHVILLPESLYDPITDWGDPVEIDLDGDGVVDGTYYVKTNDVAPMAVVAKLKNTDLEEETLRYLVEMTKPGHLPGWLTGPNAAAMATSEGEEVQIMEQVAAQNGNSANAPGQQKKQGDVVQQQDRDQDQDCLTGDCDGDPDQIQSQDRAQDHTQDYTGAGNSSSNGSTNSSANNSSNGNSSSNGNGRGR